MGRSTLTAPCTTHGTTPEVDCPRCLPARVHRDLANWMVSQGPWHYFGGLTFDPRRDWSLQRAPIGERRAVLHPSWGTTRSRHPTRLDEAGNDWLERPGVTVGAARGQLRRFFPQAEGLVGRPVRAIVALERHKSGAIHWHPLIHVQGGARHGDIAAIGPLWVRLAGGNRLVEVQQQREAAVYASTYSVKGYDQGNELYFWPEGTPTGDRRGGASERS